MSVRRQWEAAKKAALDPGRLTAECTDLRNAEQFVELHGDNVRHISAWKKWLVYDGQRWLMDETESALRLAADTARVMAAQARAAMTDTMIELERFAGQPVDPSDTARDKVQSRLAQQDRQWKWALKSQAAARLHSMVDLARADESVAVHYEQLDADPWLFNVRNGTIDLRTGELREHRRDDLITKLAPVDYDPEAKCPVWEAFLNQSMAGNTQMVEFIQRIQGYALTGVIRDHALGFLHGDGSNGKSTFISTIRSMMGDYAITAPRGMLFKARGERHPTELTTLFGARFVACAEIEEGHTFDEALLKDLTGGDEISARRMNENFWSFKPTHKLFIAGNHKPVVRGTDNGIWRRIRLIPWHVKVSEEAKDTQLPEKLRHELPGILAWVVRGCLAWQAHGLGEPMQVKDATAQYRDESDIVGEFFRLRVVFGDSADVETRKLIRSVYVSWCEENGYKPVDAKVFARKLRERGVTETTKKYNGKVEDAWRGVRLLSEVERASGYIAIGNPNREVGTKSGSFRSASKNDSSHDQPNPKTTPNVPTSLSQQPGCFDDLIDPVRDAEGA